MTTSEPNDHIIEIRTFPGDSASFGPMTKTDCDELIESIRQVLNSDGSGYIEMQNTEPGRPSKIIPFRLLRNSVIFYGELKEKE